MWACSLWWNTMLEKYDVKQKLREQDIHFSDLFLISILSFNPDYFSPRSLSWYCPLSHSLFVHFFNIVWCFSAMNTALSFSVWVYSYAVWRKKCKFFWMYFFIDYTITHCMDWMDNTDSSVAVCSLQSVTEQAILVLCSFGWKKKIIILYHTFVKCVNCWTVELFSRRIWRPCEAWNN